MDPAAVSEKLRRAREANREALEVLARRIGVRQEHLHSIEDGRFEDLPSGIYGRAAIRSFASAYGMDPSEALSACEPLLRQVEEPIEGLARLRGIRPAKPEPPAKPQPSGEPPSPFKPPLPRAFLADSRDWLDFPSWRPLAASAIDAVVIVGLLLLVVASAALSLVVPVSALQGSAGSLVLVGLVLGLGYFAWFGGLGGATLGERSMGISAADGEAPMLTLRDVAIRTLRSATEDVRCIQRLGCLLGTLLNTYRSPV